MLGALLVVGLGGTGLWAAKSAFGGTDLTEKNLSRTQQLELLNQMSPVPVPLSASDIHIKYESFQDWHFEGSFTLSPADFTGYVGQLQPRVDNSGVFEGRLTNSDGGRFAASSSVRVDHATFRIWIVAFTT